MVKLIKLNITIRPIISIWYRVDSKQITSFRQWATSVLKDYITKGFALNEKMLIEKKYSTVSS